MLDLPAVPLISSDSHVFEPPDLWVERLPKLADVPKLERVNGRDVWVLGGRLIGSTAAGQQPGLRLEDPSALKVAGLFDDVPRGAYDPDARLREQDVDGVRAEVLYSTVGMFLYGQVRDSQLLSTLCCTYNEWLAEYCGAHPSRLIGMAMLNTDDIAGAVGELERARALGLAGAMIPVFPLWDRPYEHPDYEPLWAAAEGLDMPLALHLATNRPGPVPEVCFEFPSTFSQAFLTNLDYWVRLSLTGIILSGVFERHPHLMVGCVEHELGWIPYFLFQLDYTYTDRIRRSSWPPKFASGALPSDHFRSNVFSSFQEDPIGMAHRELIGVDNLMWGSDYPHPESTWPKSGEITGRVLADVSLEERRKFLGGNVARLFRLNV